MSKLIYKTKESIVIFLPIIVVILITLAFIFTIVPSKADAQGFSGYFGPEGDVPTPFVISVKQNSVDKEGATTIIIVGSGFFPQSVVRINGFDYSNNFIDSSNLSVKLNTDEFSSGDLLYISVVNPRSYFSGGSKYSNAVSLYINTSNYNNTSISESNTYSDTGNTTSMQNGSKKDETASALAASAILGDNSLVPSGVIQWVLFAIIALLIIIIVRKFLGASDRYHESPLKHA